jgi:uncharacterized membrane protein YdjX (TVP38/TMEM64 family)
MRGKDLGSGGTPAFIFENLMHAPQPPSSRNHIFWWLLAGLAIIVLGIYLVVQFWKPVWDWLTPYYALATNKERVKAVIEAAGPLGPLMFIALQATQVIFAPIPGEATGFLGGYLFGVPLGLTYSILGLTLGSLGAFLLGHWLEKSLITRIVSRETMQRFDFLMEHQGALVAFILFLIPGFPKDYLCFILGLSPMDLWVFLVICFIGRIPGTLMLTLQGAEIYAGHYWSTFILFIVCLLIAGLAYYFRETLYVWIRRLEIYHRTRREQLNKIEESKE